ncbi:hypothetical protein ACET3X_007112 [Alternaria dauci]|uniref:Telomere replication protein EST3 n=1 Tax=Alternaria dauci TaxID=48095 RepID=A0ABR3UFM8_9PLEO
MPTYFARGVSVRLSATPLEDSTTQKIILRKGDAAKLQSESAERRLLKRRLLREEVVPFPGDEYAFQLNWVANAPFMQTRVKNDVYDKQETTTGTHLLQISDSIIATDQSFTDGASLHKPKALALHVNLSDKTYISGLYNQKTSLKIEVLFNGTLSACLFIPTHDVKSGAKSNHQVFAGTRIDFLAERPWVILPPEVAADGNARNNTSLVSVEQRWQHLCHALQTEARERGQDEGGSKPPTAEFLHALATIQMPNQVRNMQTPGGKTFGIIDVVVTAGEGRKLTSGVGYLKAPKRMVDESYPFVLDADGTTLRPRAEASGKSESEADPQNTTEPSSEVIDMDAERDGDPDYGSPPKRQAIQSRVRLTQDVSPVLPSALHHPTMGPLTPSIPPPVQVESKTTVLQTPDSKGRNLLFSPGSARVHAQLQGQDRAYKPQVDIMSQAGSALKMMFSDIPPNLQTPQMRPSPYAAQFSDPTLGGVAPNDLMRQIPFDYSGQPPSPLNRFPIDSRGTGVPTVSSFAPLVSGLPHGPSRSGPYPYSSPDQPRSDSFNTHYLRPNHNLPGVCFPLAGGSEFYKPKILPQAPAFPRLQGFSPPQAPFPPFDHRLSLPLPPAALYSVPTKPKPKRSLSPQKASSFQQAKKVKSSIEVKRLVVHGKEDSILVDHQWDPAQHIGISPNHPVKLKTQEASAQGEKQHANPLEQGRTFTENRGTKKVPVQKGSLTPTSSSEHENIGPYIATVEQQPTSTCHADVSTGQHATDAKEPILKNNPEKVAMAKLGSDKALIDTGNQDQRVTKKRSSRRTTSSTSILGVQGPKASPIWFEDPEEILREASARLRRCRPSENQGNASDVVVLPKAVVPTVQTPEAWDTGTSSPLSSLHTTPEPETKPRSYKCSPRALIESSPAPIPQADGSPERKASPEHRPGNYAPGPVKLTPILPKSQVPCGDSLTSQSPAAKKRKAAQRTLPKEPRSPNRLKTNDNPLLNRDCVTAYAESKDKKNKQGILRQVKSERLGVFTESDVVFAARFFVEE